MEDQIQATSVNGASTNGLNDKQTQNGFMTDANHTLVYFEDILFQLFKYLDVKSLQTSRRICHVWDGVATKILLQRQALKIVFYKMACYNPYSNMNTKLSDVSILIHNSRLFPCEIFYFKEGNINDKEMQNFLTLNGKNVKEVLLNMDWHDGSITETETKSKTKTKMLTKLLSEQCKNLVRVTFEFSCEEWDSDSESEEDLEDSKDQLNNDEQKKNETEKNEIFSSPLQCLKFIAINKKISTQLFNALLSAAVNLQKICFVEDKPGRLLNSYNIDCLIESNKLFLLKDLSFRPTPDELKLYEVIVKQGQLELDTIKIDLRFLKTMDEWEKAGNILSELFLKTCNQLTKINHFPPLGFLPHFVIPILPALTEIKISNCHDGVWCYENENPSHEVRIFPRGFNPKYSFPNLTRVEVDFSQEIIVRGEFINPKWDEYFPENISIPSVKTLTCSERLDILPNQFWFFPSACDCDWIHKLRQMLPNLVHAEFPLIGDFSSVSREIWQFEFLETLKFNVIGYAETIHNFPFLDSFQALTGFASDNCVAIFKGEELMQNRLIVAEMGRAKAKANPSILDLKQLKEILICFFVTDETSNSLKDKENEELLKEHSIFESVLSSYASMFCPHLDISFYLKSTKTGEIFSLVKVRKVKL